jgi:hypothetical protein
MAEIHTKAIPCSWPAHIKAVIGPTALTTSYTVVCQGVGALGEQPPASQVFSFPGPAQTAANAWVITCGLTP